MMRVAVLSACRHDIELLDKAMSVTGKSWCPSKLASPLARPRLPRVFPGLVPRGTIGHEALRMGVPASWRCGQPGPTTSTAVQRFPPLQ